MSDWPGADGGRCRGQALASGWSWVKHGIDQGGVKLSTLDLFRGSFVVLAGADCRSKLPFISEVSLLQNGKDFTAERFEELYGITKNGAVLIRPDGYVGARWIDESFPEQLASAFASILGAKN